MLELLIKMLMEKKIDGKRVLVDKERGRTQEDWKPRRLGGGRGGTRRGGDDVNTKYSGRSPPRKRSRSSGRHDREEDRRRSDRDRERDKRHSDKRRDYRRDDRSSSHYSSSRRDSRREERRH